MPAINRQWILWSLVGSPFTICLARSLVDANSILRQLSWESSGYFVLHFLLLRINHKNLNNHYHHFKYYLCSMLIILSLYSLLDQLKKLVKLWRSLPEHFSKWRQIFPSDNYKKFQFKYALLSCFWLERSQWERLFLMRSALQSLIESNNYIQGR